MRETKKQCVAYINAIAKAGEHIKHHDDYDDDGHCHSYCWWGRCGLLLVLLLLLMLTLVVFQNIFFFGFVTILRLMIMLLWIMMN